MPFKQITLENFTLFEKLEMTFSNGLNVFIGENGMGKTHVMKLIYSAGKAARHDVSFSQKVVNVFMPDDSSIGRLVSRRGSVEKASVDVRSDALNLYMRFNRRTNKWSAMVSDEEKWESVMSNVRCTFIPAKEILSNGWHFEAAVNLRNVEFDDTYVDVVSAAKIDLGGDPKASVKYLDMIQKATNGKVELNKDRFYLKRGATRLEFHLVAEGIRKLALLWQLINNGALDRGSVLFWDEPEANLNPKYIPLVAELLLELQRDGVQVFVATHDYFLCKYLEIKRGPDDQMLFHSFYSDKKVVCTETNDHFSLLEHNAIQETFIQMYEDEVRKAME